MPIINDPRVKIEYTLKSDEGRPENERTVFHFRVLTVNKFQEFAEVFDKIVAVSSGAEIVKEAIEKVKYGIIGWKNFILSGKEIPFDVDKIEELLTMDEIIELMTAMLSKQTLTIEDKKKLGSQSQSDTVKAAATVQA